MHIWEYKVQQILKPHSQDKVVVNQRTDVEKNYHSTKVQIITIADSFYKGVIINQRLSKKHKITNTVTL